MKFDKTAVQVALAELVRERKVREFYYPNAISARKLTEKEAVKRLKALKDAIAILEALLEHGVVALHNGSSITEAEVSLFEEAR